MVLVSVTRLHLKSPLYVPIFGWHTMLSTWQIINIPGFLGGKLLRDADGAFWTLTTWEDQAAMKHYRNSGAHRQVMPRLQNWCDQAAVVHWQQADCTMPTWEAARSCMVQAGHFTRLFHPAAAHLEGKIPLPQSSKLLELPLHPRKKVRSKSSGDILEV